MEEKSNYVEVKDAEHIYFLRKFMLIRPEYQFYITFNDHCQTQNDLKTVFKTRRRREGLALPVRSRFEQGLFLTRHFSGFTTRVI